MIFEPALIKKLMEEGKNALVSETDGVHVYPEGLRHINVGRINTGDLVKFLNKFGRRLSVDDAIDRFFGKPDRRWEIDFRLLYSGYLFFQRDRVEFEKAVEKCRNKQEFMMAYGIS